MPKSNAVVRARINQELKDQAAHILDKMGLTLSDAFRLLLIKIANDKELPFGIVSRPSKKELKVAIKETTKRYKKTIKDLSNR